jgi:hypothetical protein
LRHTGSLPNTYTSAITHPDTYTTAHTHAITRPNAKTDAIASAYSDAHVSPYRRDADACTCGKS